ncbi:unnamed protein product [Trifolium pratense]|uniref:Uncharacterized protein n=1 Tax=Trifolium pratense TaxID=57577 RepID=A0ACB0L173_TRIPR|nr:unnamed protein product [Trifolium pratense]
MQERLERLSKSVEYLNLESVEGSYEEDKLDENSRISQSNLRNSVPDNNIVEGDSNHLEKQMVNEELHKEGADDDIVPNHPETDRKISKQESGPTVAEDSNMYGDALVTNKQSEDRRVQTSIFPILRNWQYESSESSCSWMKASRLSAEFEQGVIEFIRFAEINLPSPESNDEKNLPPKSNVHFRCPFVLCGNKKLEIHMDEIISHLICNGICQNYTKWIWHGEVVTNCSVSQCENISVDMNDRLEDMMRDIREDSFKTAHVHDTLCSDKDTPLYPGCTNFTRLSAVLKLFNLKAKNGWTGKSFSELLELLTQMLPEGNVIPNRCYEAKKVLCPMGLEYERIHACPNDCILYRKEFANSDHCPKCMASRYKKKDGDSSDDVVTKKGSPAKVVWYLPIIPRFKGLFANANDAKNLRWHVEE